MHWILNWLIIMMTFTHAFTLQTCYKSSFFRPKQLRLLSGSVYNAEMPLQKIVDGLMRSDYSSDMKVKECIKHMADVNLSHLGFKNPVSIPSQLCTTIAETNHFHIAAFLLPKGRCIPIHDHPNMTVCSKIIVGSLRVRSFTKLVARHSVEHVTAKLDSDVVRNPSDPAWLITPIHGNFHEFTALEDTVILDVLTPPYSPPARQCTFYTAHPCEELDGDSDGHTPWLLQVTSEQDMYARHGLPMAIAYKGYVPRLGQQDTKADGQQ